MSMEAISSTATTDFLAEGGELGALMRGHDWSTSPLGTPAHWPQSLKTAFFSNVSHEFRTPLPLIVGPAEEMLGGRAGTLTETQREFIQTLRRNALRLQRLVNALLDFARVEAERTEASYE